MNLAAGPPAALAAHDAPATDWYRLPIGDASARLGTAPVSGLTESEARKRLDQ